MRKEQRIFTPEFKGKVPGKGRMGSATGQFDWRSSLRVARADLAETHLSRKGP